MHPNFKVVREGFSVPFSDLVCLDLFIAVSNDNKTFRIVKNRWGYDGDSIPISLLPDVLINPKGKLEVKTTYTWNKL